MLNYNDISPHQTHLTSLAHNDTLLFFTNRICIFYVDQSVKVCVMRSSIQVATNLPPPLQTYFAFLLTGKGIKGVAGTYESRVTLFTYLVSSLRIQVASPSLYY